MSTSFALRHARQLSSVAATAVSAATASGAISISKARSKLKSEFDPDKALHIYSSVSKNSSLVSTCFALDTTVRRLARSHRFSEIEALVESHKTDPRITQEAFVSTLIRSYGRAGMFDQALRIYNEMEELGTPRSTVSFNSLLFACVQSKLLNQVPKLFEEIPQKYDFTPDKISFGILAKSYCESGTAELAIDTLKKMEEKGIEVTAITYSTIMDALYKNGKSDEAERLWNEMISKGCLPDVGAYNVRIMQRQDGDPESVKELIEEMSNAGLKPDTITYNYLMACCCRNGRMDEAKQVYEGLEEKGCRPNVATFRILMDHLCRNGQFETGYKLFKKSVKLNKIPDFETLKHLVEGLAKKERKKEAKGLIRTVKKKFPPNCLNAWDKVEKQLGFATEKPETNE